MSWYPSADSRPIAYRPSDPGALSYPGDGRSVRAYPTTPYSPIPTSSSLGRMPLTPTYSVPVEAEVVSRADFQHVMLRAALGTNHLSPLTMPSYILDVGCGSGRWVREMAEEFRGARVVGQDITPPAESNPATSGIFTADASQPRNYAFVRHNVLEPFTFVPASFDLTHMRQMISVLPVSAWPHVVGEMVRVTAFGGWVELVEGDLVRNGGPALDMIQRWALQLMLPHGLDPRISAQLADLLRTFSVNDIRTRVIELPIGPHGGRFGELMGADFMARIEGMRAHVIAARLATSDGFTQAQETLRQEMNNWQYTQPFHVVCGRR